MAVGTADDELNILIVQFWGMPFINKLLLPCGLPCKMKRETEHYFKGHNTITLKDIIQFIELYMIVFF